MRGGHPSMRMHHPGGHGRQQGAPEQTSSKSIVTLALPMYTLGIGVFFIYTCCKVGHADEVFSGGCVTLTDLVLVKEKFRRQEMPRSPCEQKQPIQE